MGNKTGIILKALIEELKGRPKEFGEVSAVAEVHGINASRAEIAVREGGKTEVYSVIAIKHADGE